MMGSGGSVVVPQSGGLAELAALAELVKDPKKFEAVLAELTARTSAVEAREAKVKEREAALKKQETDLGIREHHSLKRLEAVAEQRAADGVKYTQRQADERLAEVNAIMGAVNGVLARLAKVVAISDDLKTTVEKARRNMGAEAA